MFSETFTAFGAKPVIINVNGIYDGLKSGRVHAQENPLAVVELFRLDQVVKYVSLTKFGSFGTFGSFASFDGVPIVPMMSEVVDHLPLAAAFWSALAALSMFRVPGSYNRTLNRTLNLEP